jgi:SAM-dependent methyltransferase
MDENAGEKSLREAHRILDERLPARARIYEAGGGSASSLPAVRVSESDITVVDIDHAQIRENRYATSKILGDIQTYSFPPSSFDLVVCYNVIEHLSDPEKAIRLFHSALAPGGLMFIGAPVRDSFSGWATRATPHWFHIQYYRWILKYASAGKPGSVPFPTVFHPIVTPRKLLELCNELGFQLVYFREYKGMIYANMAQRSPVLGKLLELAASVANFFTSPGSDLRNGDFHLIVAKAPMTRTMDEQSER